MNSSVEVYSGLFGYISGAEVKNLGIVAHNITAVLLQGDGNVYGGCSGGQESEQQYEQCAC